VDHNRWCHHAEEGTAGDVTLSAGNPDVSAPGTFGEAVTITTGGLVAAAVQPRSVLRSRLVDLSSLWAAHHTGLMNCWVRLPTVTFDVAVLEHSVKL
jgi:hypothetical protein